MNTGIRRIGFAVLGAAALPVTMMQGLPQLGTCAEGYHATFKDYQFGTETLDLVRNRPDDTDLKAYVTIFQNGRHLLQAKDQLSRMRVVDYGEDRTEALAAAGAEYIISDMSSLVPLILRGKIA